jgi:hypothetical protein
MKEKEIMTGTYFCSLKKFHFVFVLGARKDCMELASFARQQQQKTINGNEKNNHKQEQHCCG